MGDDAVLLRHLLQIVHRTKYIRLNLALVKLRFGYIKKVNLSLICLVLLLGSAAFMGYSINLVSAQAGSTIAIMSDGSSVPQQPHFPQLADPTITIFSDGSVVGTDKIQRQGNVYTFTGDIFGTIKVEKYDITIDGAGYAIKGNGNGINLRKDSTTMPHGYGDVVVKNVRFCDNSRIFAASNGNSFINNVFEGGGIDINGIDNSDVDKVNLIKCNVFIDGKPAISSDYSGETVVAENDFINCRVFLALYGWLDFDRNYWSDYEILYPSAKEVGRTGVWDIPYRYDKTDFSDFPFVDYNALVNPTNGMGAPKINSENTPFYPSVPVNEDQLESFPTALMIATVIVSVIIVGISLLVYFKKCKYHTGSF